MLFHEITPQIPFRAAKGLDELKFGMETEYTESVGMTTEDGFAVGEDMGAGGFCSAIISTELIKSGMVA